MNMIERVARALCEEAGASPNEWKDFSGRARVAIDAMREPSEAMAACAHAVEHCGHQEPHFKNAYTAMIDAALREK